MAILPDYTVPDGTSWDPTGSGLHQFDISQYGFAQNSPNRIYTQEQCWFHDPSVRRIGSYGIRITSFHNSANVPNASTFLGVRQSFNPGPGPGSRGGGAGGVHAGDEEWVGLSYRWPANYPGTASWGGICEFGSGVNFTHPSYGGISLDAKDPDRFYLRFKTGKTPPPGSADFNPLPPPAGNGWNTEEPLLGSTAPHPYTKDVWHDFIIHCRLPRLHEHEHRG